MRIVHESVEVKGEGARDVELKFTRHGPVVYVDEANKRAFAIRSIWFEPGTSAYFGSSDYMTAKDWNGFVAAIKRWGAPSENQVYADVKGNIGWIPGAKTPRRVNYDGLMPVPGDGRYEWQGFIDNDELPRVYRPEQGFFATANQMNLPSRLSSCRTQDRLRMVGPGALAAHCRSVAVQAEDDAGGRDGFAERRHLDAGAASGQVAEAASVRRRQYQKGAGAS